MQIGMPTLIRTKSIQECALLCKELGLNFIELNMNLPQYQLEDIDVARFAEVAKQNGIYYTIHLDENLNVCDFNKKVADAYLETVLQTIDIAKKLEIPVINMHMSAGVYFTIPHEKIYLFKEYIGTYLASLKAFREKCEKAIGNANIKICIENGYNLDFLLKGVALLLESDVFALTFDIGHNWSGGGIDEAFIMANKNKLYHMHIHDALGKKNHLALGTGELDLPKYFYLASKHNCRVVLETKNIDGLKQSVEWVKSKA